MDLYSPNIPYFEIKTKGKGIKRIRRHGEGMRKRQESMTSVVPEVWKEVTFDPENLSGVDLITHTADFRMP